MVTICTISLTFNNSTFCPHSVFVCFVRIWQQTAIISLYSINWLVCITETECVYCAVIQVICFVWISEQTAIISLYSINWLVFITEMGLLRGTGWIFKYNSRSYFRVFRSGVGEVSVLLGYSNSLIGNRILTFRHNLMSWSSRVGRS